MACAPELIASEVLPAYEQGPQGVEQPREATLERAAAWLGQSVPVVIPTETVYGLAAPARDRAAVSRVFAIKQRPLDNPLIVHVAGPEQLPELGVRFSSLAERLTRAFWPGPLTLVLPTEAELPWVTAGLDSIAVRQPRHAFALALIRRSGPLAAPSANLSGLPSPTRASHALRDLTGRVPLIVDGGELDHGVESTVVDARGERPVLLRPGALSLEEIEACCGAALSAPNWLHGDTPNPEDGRLRSPGLKYRHYSPHAQLWLYPELSAHPAAARQLEDDLRELRAAGRRVAVIARAPFDADRQIPLPDDPRTVARQLFAWLRELDEDGVDCILVEGQSPIGLGRAIMDRLERAASRVRRPAAAAPAGEGA